MSSFPPCGPDRDLAIAEALGWKLTHLDDPIGGGSITRLQLPDGSLAESLPAWSTDSRDNDKLIDWMGEHGWWCRTLSPFSPGQPHFAGFTPHQVTGWNGRPDFECEGVSRCDAVSSAVLLTLRGK